MKCRNFKNSLTIFLYLVLAVGFFSCVMAPIDNYAGAIVHEKKAPPPAGRRFLLQIHRNNKKELKIVHVTEFDYKRYDVGDTIK